MKQIRWFDLAAPVLTLIVIVTLGFVILTAVQTIKAVGSASYCMTGVSTDNRNEGTTNWCSERFGLEPVYPGVPAVHP